MATKKKAKKKTTHNKQRTPGLQERAVIALERIVDYLQPKLIMAEYKHTEVHGGTGLSETELAEHGVAAAHGIAAAGEATAVAAADRKFAMSTYNIPTDEELLS